MAATAQARVHDTEADSAGSDIAAIESVIWTYFDGLHEGDTEKLGAAFHPCAHLYAEDKGGVLDWSREHWFDMVRKRPSAKSQGHPRYDKIVSIDQSGPGTAFVKVECALPPRFFVDYLMLVKTNEGWRIVSKAFKAEMR